MFWRWAGLFAEGRAWLDAALAGGTGSTLEVRCQGLWGAGWLAYHQGEHAADAVINRLYLDRARESMTAEAFAETWREGHALTLAEALAEGQAID